MSKTKITGLKPINFPSTVDGSIMTSTDASKYVNTFFSKIFADYKGCVISIDQTADPSNPQSALNANHPVQCQLYFAVGTADKDDKRLRAFEILSSKDKSDSGKKEGRMHFVSQMRSYQMAMTENKVSCITQDAVDILGDLLWYELRNNLPENATPKTFNDRGISLETCTTSTSQQNMFGTPQDNKVIYGVVRFVDINEIFHMIFGDEKDSRCYYQTVPVKPVVPPFAGMNMTTMAEQKWVLNLTRLNEKAVRDVLTELGTGAPALGPNINTATI